MKNLHIYVISEKLFKDIILSIKFKLWIPPTFCAARDYYFLATLLLNWLISRS